MGSDYFKTALNTNVGDGLNTVEVKECSHHVLSTIIDFMYGIALPQDLGLKELCSLLAMSDLYLMTGLRDAVAPLLGKHLKLQEQCSSYIFDNIDVMGPQLLDNLAKALPMVG